MNKPASYEITIAEKLQQLPVPDMEDAIWASIEQQLDAGFPDSDAGNGNNNPQVGGGAGTAKIIVGTATIIAGAAILYYAIKKDDAPQNNRTTPAVEKTVPVINPAEQAAQQLKPDTTAYVPPLLQKKQQTNSPATAILPPKHIILQQPVLPIVKDDSVKVFTPPQLMKPQIDSVTAPAHPKPKGVKGITPGDYRIKGSKDTVQKSGS